MRRSGGSYRPTSYADASAHGGEPVRRAAPQYKSPIRDYGRMSWESDAASALTANDVETIAYLPDSAAAPLVERVRDDDAFEVALVNREEEGVGVASGAWLGGQRGALICQSSGLATAINALASLNKPARIPFLGIVTRRGDLGEFNLAQVPAGYGMSRVLDAIGVRNYTVERASELRERVDLAAKTAFSTEEPYVLLLDATVTGAKDEH